MTPAAEGTAPLFAFNDGVLIAIITALIGLIGGIVTFLGHQVRDLHARVDSMRHENAALWLWARELVDYAYRYRRDDAPDLPRPPPKPE